MDYVRIKKLRIIICTKKEVVTPLLLLEKLTEESNLQQKGIKRIAHKLPPMHALDS